MTEMIVLRIVHIGFALFWAGSVLFMNIFVGPALSAAGPAGFRVLHELKKRHYFDVLLGAATLTILSGLDLVRRDSGDFNRGWFESHFGMGISIGMLAAFISFLVGLLAVRPILSRMADIGGQIASATPESRGSLGMQLEEHRGRLVAFGGVAMLFLLIAIIAMSVARYI